jgi:His-Xaa-Ser system protein HxsD
MGKLKKHIKINKIDDLINIKINTNVYSKKVIYTTCYALTDKIYVHLKSNPNSEFEVELKPKHEQNLEKLALEFENELIKYAFYEKQHNDNLALKILMLKKILILADPEARFYIDQQYKEELDKIKPLINNEPTFDFEDEPDDDFLDDPEGIAIPWEEKYGKKNEKKSNKKNQTKKK